MFNRDTFTNELKNYDQNRIREQIEELDETCWAMLFLKKYSLNFIREFKDNEKMWCGFFMREWKKQFTNLNYNEFFYREFRNKIQNGINVFKLHNINFCNTILNSSEFKEYKKLLEL